MATETSAESSATERKRSGEHRNRTPTQHLVLAVAAISDDGLSNTCQHAMCSHLQHTVANDILSGC